MPDNNRRERPSFVNMEANDTFDFSNKAAYKQQFRDRGGFSGAMAQTPKPVRDISLADMWKDGRDSSNSSDIETIMRRNQRQEEEDRKQKYRAFKLKDKDQGKTSARGGKRLQGRPTAGDRKELEGFMKDQLSSLSSLEESLHLNQRKETPEMHRLDFKVTDGENEREFKTR